MQATVLRALQAGILVATLLLLSGCGKTRINSVLELESWDWARIELHQKTEAIELHNTSKAPVAVEVLAKKDKVMQSMELNADEKVTLDLVKAKAISFENEANGEAVVRWTLVNKGTIEYTMDKN